MSFPFLKSFQLPNFSAKCDAAFFEAIKRLDLESCEAFIDARPADYLEHLTDAEGNNALHIAVQKWEGIGIDDISLQVELIRLLLAHRIDPLKKNAHGVAALNLAKKARPEIAALFDINPQPASVVDVPAPVTPAPVIPTAPVSISSPAPISPPAPTAPISPAASSTTPVSTSCTPTTSATVPPATPAKPVSETSGEAEEEGGLEFPTASTTVEAFLKSNGMQEYEEQFKEKVGVSLRSER